MCRAPASLSLFWGSGLGLALARAVFPGCVVRSGCLLVLQFLGPAYDATSLARGSVGCTASTSRVPELRAAHGRPGGEVGGWASARCSARYLSRTATGNGVGPIYLAPAPPPSSPSRPNGNPPRSLVDQAGWRAKRPPLYSHPILSRNLAVYFLQAGSLAQNRARAELSMEAAGQPRTTRPAAAVAVAPPPCASAPKKPIPIHAHTQVALTKVHPYLPLPPPSWDACLAAAARLDLTYLR